MPERPANPAHADRPWALPVALAVVLAIVAAWRLWPATGGDSDGANPRGAPAEFAYVELDNADGATSTARVAWRSGVVLDLLRRAGEQDPAFAPEVEGAMAMVTAIGGRRNEGAGGRNWLFEVNGELSQVGAGAARVRPGDRVLWKFIESE